MTPARRVLIAGIASIPASLLLVGLGHSLRLHCFVVALIAAPLVAAALAPELWRRRREVALGLGSLAVALLLVHLAGPWLTRVMLPAQFGLDIEHRLLDCEPCPNRDGVALRPPATSTSADAFVIVFLGDSYAYGDGLDDPLDAFPFVVEELLQQARPELEVQVANFAWPSSCPLLQWRQLEELGPRYRPDLVIQAFDMSDFHDDLVYARQLDEVGLAGPDALSVWRVLDVRLSLLLGVTSWRGWLQARALRRDWRDPFADPDRIWSRQARHFAMSAPLDQTRELLEPTWRNLEAIDAASDRLGADFAVVVLPRYQHYDPSESPRDWAARLFPMSPEHIGEPFAWFEQKRSDAGFPVHSLLPAFEASGAPGPVTTVFPDDPHYNVVGHRIAGDAIARFVLEEGLLP